MINAKILNNTTYNQTNPFSQPQKTLRGGNPKSQPHLSPPKHPIGREEDRSGVLTIPPNLFKKELERLNEELVKKPRLPFNYWQLKNGKIPLTLQNPGCIRANSDKSMDFTIYKDEIHKYIAEIKGLTRISPKYIEDLMKYSEIQIRELNSKLMYNVNVYK